MKRKTRVFVSDFSFFSLHSWTKELKKDEIWDKNTILQPIEKSYNDFNAFFAKVKLNKDGTPVKESLREAAKLHAVLKFTAQQ